MKFIISFLFAFIFLNPAMADVTDVAICNEKTDSDTCNGTAGCEWGEDICSTCASGTYNDGSFSDGCHSCDNLGLSDYQAIVNSGTKQHPSGASSCTDWICNEGRIKQGDQCTQCPSLSNGQELKSGATSCDDWQCIVDWYKSGDGCTYCPANTSTKQTPGATSIKDCICNDPNKVLNTDGNCVPCSGDVVGNTCRCDQGQYWDGQTCESCPAHSTTDRVGATDINECKCETNYIPNDKNNIAQGCKRCPSGLFTDKAGAADASACHATSNTKFCDASGENCMYLIP